MHRTLRISITVGSAILCALTALPLVAQTTSNVYRPDETNTVQQAKVVTILMITPAKVVADNSQAQKTARVAGGLLGAVGGAVVGNNLGRSPGRQLVGGAFGGATGIAVGSLAPATKLVDGVSITYDDQGQTLNAAQVGKLCEFTQGKAVVTLSTPTHVRIQPNATCPATK